jgi:ech hydrogenase subunit F
MGSFKLGKMTLRSLFKKPETVLYPIESRPQPDDLKGSIEIDIKKCTLCQVCAKRCPTNSITVNKEEETWTIDRFDCIQCRTCVRECAFDCLHMAPDYKKPAKEKSVDTYKKPELTEEEKAEKAKKEAEKAARIKAAKEAKAAREKAKQDNGDSTN